jgi:hypothetical protein
VGSLVLFESFLCPRTQKVITDGIGSPHGSVFPLILFACFISNVSDYIRSGRFNLYVDDLQIYPVDKDGDVNLWVALINGDLQRILDWFFSDAGFLEELGRRMLVVI